MHDIAVDPWLVTDDVRPYLIGQTVDSAKLGLLVPCGDKNFKVIRIE
jgi:hypothetical protein